jgi:hypothetical protein
VILRDFADIGAMRAEKKISVPLRMPSVAVLVTLCVSAVLIANGLARCQIEGYTAADTARPQQLLSDMRHMSPGVYSSTDDASTALERAYLLPRRNLRGWSSATADVCPMAGRDNSRAFPATEAAKGLLASFEPFGCRGG